MREESEKNQPILHTCSCGHTHIISKREIELYQGITITLWKIFVWCKKNNIHEFRREEVRHILDNVSYAKFGDWIWFGGLVYKIPKRQLGEPRVKGVKRKQYGLNMERCEQFFRGRISIPVKILKDPITNEIEVVQQMFFNEIPKLEEFLNTDGDYVVQYRNPSVNPEDGQSKLF